MTRSDAAHRGLRPRDQRRASLVSLEEQGGKLLEASEGYARESEALKQFLSRQKRARAKLREKRRHVKDMKLMLHSYLSSHDPSDLVPRMAFLDVAGCPAQPDAEVAAAIALA